MDIRPFNAYDIPAIEEFYAIYEAALDWRVGLNLDLMLDCADDESDYFIGAFDESSLVGVISVGGADEVPQSSYDSERHLEDALISDLYVIPEYRHMGVGSALINAAIMTSLDDYGGNVYAYILDDALLDLYSMFGFTAVDNSGLIVKRFRRR